MLVRVETAAVRAKLTPHVVVHGLGRRLRDEVLVAVAEGAVGGPLGRREEVYMKGVVKLLKLRVDFFFCFI